MEERKESEKERENGGREGGGAGEVRGRRQEGRKGGEGERVGFPVGPDVGGVNAYQRNCLHSSMTLRRTCTRVSLYYFHLGLFSPSLFLY